MTGHQGRALFVKNRVHGDAGNTEPPGSLYPVADLSRPELVGVGLVDQLPLLFASKRSVFFSKDAHGSCEGFGCGKSESRKNAIENEVECLKLKGGKGERKS